MNGFNFKYFILLFCSLFTTWVLGQNDSLKLSGRIIQLSVIKIEITFTNPSIPDSLNIKSKVIDSISVKKKKPYSLHGFFSVSEAYHKNWTLSESDVNNIAVACSLEGIYKKTKKNVSTKQTCLAEYGYQKITDSIFIKNIDRLCIKSQMEIHLTKLWSLKLNNTLSTQFNKTFEWLSLDDGSKIKHIASSFLSPGYNNMSIGINCNFWSGSSINIGLSSTKITLVQNQNLYVPNYITSIFGVEQNKRWLFEYGWGSQATINRELIKNINWECTWVLFSNKNKPKNVDVEILNKFSLKVNKYVKTVISARLIYDEDISNKLQLQQQLLIGYYF